jgi:FKBP-type peptidyl-prolyl cis-trans isomerase FklB
VISAGGRVLAVGMMMAFAGPALAQAPALAPTTITLPAIRYEVLRQGDPQGSHPTRDSAVKVRYKGTLADGTVFIDSAARGDGTEIFPLGGRIPGFVTILQAMRPGDRWRAFIPAAFAYPTGPAAVAGKDLTFDIELIDFAQLPSSGSPLMNALPKKD